MKREIKFRAYIKDEGRLLNVNLIDFDDEYVRVWDEYGENKEEWFFKDCELMQFTGLHDKNGREIYESDILRVTTEEDNESYEATVKWFGDEYYPAFDLEGIPAAWNYDANALSTIFNSGAETCEAIGNIHYTPELLEKEK